MSSNIRIMRICEFCGNEFTARTTVTKYCQHRCASLAYKSRARNQKVETSNSEVSATISAPTVELQAKDFLNVKETCQLLGISRWTMSRAIEDGRLKAVKLGRRILIKRTEIDRMFA
ncbi:MAG: helix-turn-helix domain-containing protein [Acidobacteriota bacterium]